MRVLLLFRGSPGVGKSTWIRKHDLGDYVLSADQIRLMYSSPQLSVDGGEEINLTNDKFVWNTLLSILEKRMENGEFTVIDATNSKTSEMKRYVNLAEKYKYRIYCIDMTDVPINVCKERNERRFPMYKRVPEQAIDNMYARFATQKFHLELLLSSLNSLRKRFYIALWMLVIIRKCISLEICIAA